MGKLIFFLLLLTVLPAPSFCATTLNWKIALEIAADSDDDVAYVRKNLTQEFNRLGDIQVVSDAKQADLILEVIGSRVISEKNELWGYSISATLLMVSSDSFTAQAKQILEVLELRPFVFVDSVISQNSADHAYKVFRDVINYLDDRDFDKWRRVMAAAEQVQKQNK